MIDDYTKPKLIIDPHYLCEYRRNGLITNMPEMKKRILFFIIFLFTGKTDHDNYAAIPIDNGFSSIIVKFSGSSYFNQ